MFELHPQMEMKLRQLLSSCVTAAAPSRCPTAGACRVDHMARGAIRDGNTEAR
jgi:hypothetical protein